MTRVQITMVTKFKWVLALLAVITRVIASNSDLQQNKFAETYNRVVSTLKTCGMDHSIVHFLEEVCTFINYDSQDFKMVTLYHFCCLKSQSSKEKQNCHHLFTTRQLASVEKQIDMSESEMFHQSSCSIMEFCVFSNLQNIEFSYQSREGALGSLKQMMDEMSDALTDFIEI